MIAPAAAARSRNPTSERSVLSQLLHGLNQPLTGLQCAMEVALAAPRTIEQYAEGLRQGLELTERMRALVEALREVADLYDGRDASLSEIKVNGLSELASLTAPLREVADELRPLAEAGHIRIVDDLASTPAAFAATEQKSSLARVVFRLLDATLSMAAPGTELRLASGTDSSSGWLRLQWRAKEAHAALSRPELGMLIAQAWLDGAGCEWERETRDDLERLTIRLPRSG